MGISSTISLMKFVSWDDGFHIPGVSGGIIPRARMVKGDLSDATAIVIGIARQSKTLTIQNITGTFTDGETVRLFGDEIFPRARDNNATTAPRLPGVGVLLAASPIVAAPSPPFS